MQAARVQEHAPRAWWTEPCDLSRQCFATGSLSGKSERVHSGAGATGRFPEAVACECEIRRKPALGLLWLPGHEADSLPSPRPSPCGRRWQGETESSRPPPGESLSVSGHWPYTSTRSMPPLLARSHVVRHPVLAEHVAAPSRRRCSRPRCRRRRRSATGPAGRTGTRSGPSPRRRSRRRAARPRPCASPLPCGSAPASRCRAASTASVPDSPQQRSFSGTVVAHQRRSRSSAARAASSACGRGRGTCSARPSTPSSLMPFSSRYSWMSMIRQPGKIFSNS